MKETMEELTNNREQHLDDKEAEVADLAVRSLEKSLATNSKEKKGALTEMSPTQGLYAAVFGELPENDIEEAELPKLLYILDTLANREEDIVKKRFGIEHEKEGYTDIARDYGVTPPTIRATEQKAIRKLQHPSRGEYIRLLFMSREELRDNILAQNKQVDALNEEVSKLERALEQERLKYQELLNQQEGKPNEVRPKRQLSVRELGLSTLTSNALRRSGINTVEDILEYGLDRLKRIRNLGDKSLAEVEAIIAEMGFPPLN